MQAIRVEQFGEPDVLRVQPVLDLHPGPDELLVEVKAAGVNPVDIYIRAGIYPINPSFPYTPGFDGAGIVKEVGDNINKFAVNDHVYISGSLTGTYAQETLCHINQVFLLPENISFAQGAGIGIPYLTAYRALFTKARAAAQETVLIHGASGGVGIAAIQLARNSGLKIIATAGSPEGLLLTKQQGSHYVLDHSQQGYLENIKKITSGEGVDIILEMRADLNLGEDLKILGKSGRVIIVGCRGAVTINPREIMSRDAAIIGMTLFNIPEHERVKVYESFAEAFESEKLFPIVGREFTLNEAPQAHRSVLESKAFGKVVIRI